MKLLVIRFSALGDVAMTVPVIDSLARQYPELDITVLSRPFMQPLFAEAPSNVHFRGVDVNRYKGLGGLFRLFRELKKERHYDAVADLHDVLRTQILRMLFIFSGAKIAHIDKGRKEKRKLVKPKHKELRQLPSSFIRYEEVLDKLGYPIEPTFCSIYSEGKGAISLFQSVTGMPDDKHWIGIAPFAAHRGKTLPDTTIAQLIEEASSHKDWRIFLFGGGKTETEKLELWSKAYNNVLSLAGKLKLDEELALMSHLKVMVSMDSANMHLASLTATPVISIWGATHPFAGFMGWGQTAGNAIQTEDLPCRPCSIFGNKPCLRDDYACLTQIKVQSIIQKVESVISKKP
ncbi:glycosyltransferase family 9 protein [Bacteroides sp. L10-4]|uniref:glycosyltransferase family 9 protein n=1 Tax=Bacteroides sp. L10-4 TaxID=2746063 RepID=UPI001594F126|nr:glycosyltransferase family 9 protein [Bacteroides sp. L10-4]NVK91997.1 glycosyltransferase family 9 protein [Bacteroides sp. L10-4]